MAFTVSLPDIHKANDFLKQHLVPTPLLYSDWLSEEYQADVYLKLESMQPIGSFKIRGASYRISKLSKKEKEKGVIAASAGNHAQGVAWGSRLQGVGAQIVMPVNAPLTKMQSAQALGAEIILKGKNYDGAYAESQEIVKASGRTFIHAYEDVHVIAGQGTVGLEILDQLPEADIVIGSMGGGGLMAGVSAAMKESGSKAKLIGCQAAGASALVESLQKGEAVTLTNTQTFADGINVGKGSENMRSLLARYVDATEDVTDAEIAAAVLLLMEKMRVVAEGSGAAPLATLNRMAKTKEGVAGKKIVLIVSGGNIDVNLLGRIIDLGLTQAGRRLKMEVLIDDRPGALSRLTGWVAEQGGNILHALHDRNDPRYKIDQTEVTLTVETKGKSHSQKLVDGLKKLYPSVNT